MKLNYITIVVDFYYLYIQQNNIIKNRNYNKNCNNITVLFWICINNNLLCDNIEYQILITDLLIYCLTCTPVNL